MYHAHLLDFPDQTACVQTFLAYSWMCLLSSVLSESFLSTSMLSHPQLFSPRVTWSSAAKYRIRKTLSLIRPPKETLMQLLPFSWCLFQVVWFPSEHLLYVFIEDTVGCWSWCWSNRQVWMDFIDARCQLCHVQIVKVILVLNLRFN